MSYVVGPSVVVALGVTGTQRTTSDVSWHEARGQTYFSVTRSPWLVL